MTATQIEFVEPWIINAYDGKREIELVVDVASGIPQELRLYLNSNRGEYHPISGSRLDRNDRYVQALMTGANEVYVPRVGIKVGQMRFRKISDVVDMVSEASSRLSLRILTYKR